MALSMSEYEVVIGLEVHSQLLTKSKMFCSCASVYQDAPPNSTVCEVCMGMPGVLPVINSLAVELVIATGLALDCDISRHTKFDRKNYPYPDLMKGYQISQYDMPIATGGHLDVEVNGHSSRLGITRVHLEEDVAKLMHRSEGGRSYSLLDVNRAGVPLMEVVSEPDMRSADEARSYLVLLRSILRYAGVSTANMEEGSFRCDANISVRPSGTDDLGTKVEVKNMNSFRSVHSALEYEAERQTALVRQGKRIVQETRGWSEERGVTVSQRTKEGASDYRYFPEPDLPPLVIDDAWVERVRERLPELPHRRKARFIEQFGLSPYDADLLTASKPMADYFEQVVAACGKGGKADGAAKAASNWVLGDLTRLLNATQTEIKDSKVAPGQLAELLRLIGDGTLSTPMARSVLDEMFETGKGPSEIAEASGMVQVSDDDVVGSVVAEVVAANPQPVSDYLSGKEAAAKYLVGQVMKATRGKANPQVASRLVKDRLESLRQS